MGTAILDIIENGILILDPDLGIRLWNKWLITQTGISKEDAVGNTLDQLFKDTSFTILKRKIRISLTMHSSTFLNSAVEGYLIPIELPRITKSIFRHMRQNVVITPLNNTRVSVVIYDATPLHEAQAVIDNQMKQLEKQARTDALTQCFNKKMFNEILTMEVKKGYRYHRSFSLIIFDIDNFKKVNDTYGHLEGDHVLREIAAVCKKVIRKSDILARWGGEEFCLLLPETEIHGAALLADKLRIAIERHHFGKSCHQYCSFGVASYPPEASEDDLIEMADKALYHAKRNGKNQVAVFSKDGITTWFSATPTTPLSAD